MFWDFLPLKNANLDNLDWMLEGMDFFSIGWRYCRSASGAWSTLCRLFLLYMFELAGACPYSNTTSGDVIIFSRSALSTASLIEVVQYG